MVRRRLRSIAHTKLSPPRLPEKPVALDRQLASISLRPDCRLTLVRAPSGFGKSTFCSAWHSRLKDTGERVAWVTFDGADNNFQQVFSCLSAALVEAHAAGMSFTQERADIGQFSSIPEACDILINTACRDNTRLFFFLDDAHRINDPRSLQLLSYLIVNSPPEIGFIISSGVRPGLQMNHLHAVEAVQVIDTDLLKLTNDEARQLLSNELPELAPETAEALNSSMEGWVTGLKIAARGMAHNQDSIVDIGLYQSNIWLRDYIRDNIFSYMSKFCKDILLKCCVAESIDEGLSESDS